MCCIYIKVYALGVKTLHGLAQKQLLYCFCRTRVVSITGATGVVSNNILLVISNIILKGVAN